MLFHRRRQLHFGLANTPHAAIQYAELNKTLRKALAADLHAHHLRILEQAVAANHLRRARSELATSRTKVVHLLQRDGQHTMTTAEAATLVHTFYNDLYRSVNMAVKKCREYNLRLSMLFANFQKAFDMIEFRAIWNSLAHYGVDSSIIEVVKKLYASSSSTISFTSSEVTIDVQRGI
uniref:Reverse transcriptase domain-containing protein n=1 Tax=Plectus sambesii TaxID=2011161 RepID=A0A914XL01_9BILA